MFLQLKTVLLLTLLTSCGALSVSAQQTKTGLSVKEKPVVKERKEEKKDEKKGPINLTGEQVAETTVAVYSNLRGRDGLNQIRKTTVEQGKINSTNADGKTDQANYEVRVLRADKMDKEKIRFDQSFPDTKFSLVYDGEKVFGIYNNAAFTPRADAVKAFQNRIWHSIEALLRYKENESKIELAERQKIAGVDFYVLNLTDKENRRTTYYISSKSFRVMMLEYAEDDVKYKRKFYDYNIAQGTLVPFRSVLWANDKQIEEIDLGTVTYGQKVEGEMFSVN